MTDDAARADREAFRQQRLAMLTGLGGSLSMVAVPAVPTGPATVEGVPGTWGLPHGADGAQVTAGAAEGVRVDGDLPRPEAERATRAGRLGSDEQHRRDSPGDLAVTLDGRVHRLAVYASFVPGVVTVNFTDATSGSETPRSGRMVVLPAAADGPVVLDLDAAMLLPHEPSSVHPCPVPPVGDHLPVAVRAGERAVRFDR